MTSFTPLTALAGGALIGVAASILLALDGRVAGISGIVGGLFDRSAKGEEKDWRGAFLGGLFAGGLAVAFLAREALTPSIAAPPAALTIVAGLLVGAGTQIGQGCTSGHGVCGLSRLSKRSLVATITFMAVAMASTFVVRHVLHLGAPS
ncbi:MAG: YeeE/YedE family protein [Labilithrix sp.]|nr:YeeE/YedE family protein [Labilithrix sp.]MCW5812114.1 YeeE/YedE family protein [Labilithrix sp.]